MVRWLAALALVAVACSSAERASAPSTEPALPLRTTVDAPASSGQEPRAPQAEPSAGEDAQNKVPFTPPPSTPPSSALLPPAPALTRELRVTLEGVALSDVPTAFTAGVGGLALSFGKCVRIYDFEGHEKARACAPCELVQRTVMDAVSLYVVAKGCPGPTAELLRFDLEPLLSQPSPKPQAVLAKKYLGSIADDGDHLVAAGGVAEFDAGLVRIAKSDFSEQPIAKGKALQPSGFWRRELVVDDSSVYWLEGASGGGTAILRAPKAGGAPTLLARAVLPTGLVGDKDALFYVEEQTGRSVPQADLVMVPTRGGERRVVYSYELAGGITLAEGDVLVAHAEVGKANAGRAITRVPRGKGKPSLVTHATPLELAYWQGHVFYFGIETEGDRVRPYLGGVKLPEGARGSR